MAEGLWRVTRHTPEACQAAGCGCPRGGASLLTCPEGARRGGRGRCALREEGGAAAEHGALLACGASTESGPSSWPASSGWIRLGKSCQREVSADSATSVHVVGFIGCVRRSMRRNPTDWGGRALSLSRTHARRVQTRLYTAVGTRQAAPCAPSSSALGRSRLARRRVRVPRARSSRHLLHPACAARPGSRALASHSPRTVQSIARPSASAVGRWPVAGAGRLKVRASERPSVQTSESGFFTTAVDWDINFRARSARRARRARRWFSGAGGGEEGHRRICRGRGAGAQRTRATSFALSRGSDAIITPAIYIYSYRRCTPRPSVCMAPLLKSAARRDSRTAR